MSAPPIAGVVYVLINPAMPDLVKVGYTKNTAEERARQLRTTGVPQRFIVLWDEAVKDVRAVEARAHAELASWRPDPQREFFEVPPKQAIRVVMEAAKSHRLVVPNRRSRNLIGELRARFGERVAPGIIDAWIAVDNGAVLFSCSGAGAVLSTRLGQLAFEDQPALSPVDDPDTSADALLATPEAVLAPILGRALVD